MPCHAKRAALSIGESTSCSARGPRQAGQCDFRTVLQTRSRRLGKNEGAVGLHVWLCPLPTSKSKDHRVTKGSEAQQSRASYMAGGVITLHDRT